MRRLTFILACLMLLCSCQRERMHGDSGKEPQQHCVKMSIELDAGVTKSTAGQAEEDRIANLAVICLPLENGSENWKDCAITTFDDPDVTEGVFTANVNTFVGNNVFYVLTNYTQEMLEFVQGTSVGAGKGFRKDRASAFAPAIGASGFGQRQEELIGSFRSDSRGYAMMAKCTDGSGSSTVFIAPGATSASLDGELHRMVANVHMEFATYPDNPDYVVIEGFIDTHAGEIPADVLVEGVSESSGSQAGWIPLNSIRYCLNAVNTKVYLEADALCDDPSVFASDPNFLLDDVIVPVGADWTYADGYGSDFIYWDPNAAEELFDSLDGTASWMTAPPGVLYCLENTVSSTDFLKGFDLASSYRRIAPRRATTHLLVEARFTPRYIIIGRTAEGTREHIYRSFSNIEDAIAILKDNEHLSEPGDGTFWTPDLRHFYNWEGVQAEIAYSQEMHTADPSYRQFTLNDFVKYSRGKCYYTAFISGETATDPDTGRQYITFVDGESSVRRDASYTLNAKVLHVPSISTTMMEINTSNRLTWPERDGHGEINILPQ